MKKNSIIVFLSLFSSMSIQSMQKITKAMSSKIRKMATFGLTAGSFGGIGYFAFKNAKIKQQKNTQPPINEKPVVAKQLSVQTTKSKTKRTLQETIKYMQDKEHAAFLDIIRKKCFSEEKYEILKNIIEEQLTITRANLAKPPDTPFHSPEISKKDIETLIKDLEKCNVNPDNVTLLLVDKYLYGGSVEYSQGKNIISLNKDSIINRGFESYRIQKHERVHLTEGHAVKHFLLENLELYRKNLSFKAKSSLIKAGIIQILKSPLGSLEKHLFSSTIISEAIVRWNSLLETNAELIPALEDLKTAKIFKANFCSLVTPDYPERKYEWTGHPSIRFMCKKCTEIVAMHEEEERERKKI
ncbi:MAG TPA: hypothetical protein VEK38_02645 [Candidatus Bathyarchaeia archaeon]|nr:hypothetical protein [Candidatus Bathyarchaeia archaeon]